MYVIQNEKTKLMARHDSEGQHDGLVTDDVCCAKEFRSRGAASDYSQNFGPDWNVVPLFDEQPYEVDFSRVRNLDESLGGLPPE